MKGVLGGRGRVGSQSQAEEVPRCRQVQRDYRWDVSINLPILVFEWKVVYREITVETTNDKNCKKFNRYEYCMYYMGLWHFWKWTKLQNWLGWGSKVLINRKDDDSQLQGTCIPCAESSAITVLAIRSSASPSCIAVGLGWADYGSMMHNTMLQCKQMLVDLKTPIMDIIYVKLANLRVIKILKYSL